MLEKGLFEEQKQPACTSNHGYYETPLTCTLMHLSLLLFIFKLFPNPTGAVDKYGLELGDHAIAENIVPCWECRYCKRGSYNMCESSWTNHDNLQIVILLQSLSSSITMPTCIVSMQTFVL